jgi:hypothetical protein
MLHQSIGVIERFNGRCNERRLSHNGVVVNQSD